MRWAVCFSLLEKETATVHVGRASWSKVKGAGGCIYFGWKGEGASLPWGQRRRKAEERRDVASSASTF